MEKLEEKTPDLLMDEVDIDISDSAASDLENLSLEAQDEKRRMEMVQKRSIMKRLLEKGRNEETRTTPTTSRCKRGIKRSTAFSILSQRTENGSKTATICESPLPLSTVCIPRTLNIQQTHAFGITNRSRKDFIDDFRQYRAKLMMYRKSGNAVRTQVHVNDENKCPKKDNPFSKRSFVPRKLIFISPNSPVPGSSKREILQVKQLCNKNEIGMEFEQN